MLKKIAHALKSDTFHYLIFLSLKAKIEAHISINTSQLWVYESKMLYAANIYYVNLM